jgi:hypothetical protein
MTPHETMPLGVVLEQRSNPHPWAGRTWRAVAVIAGAPPPAREPPGSGEERFHAATLELGLYRRETEGYRVNLSQPRPAVYVVVRAAGNANARPEPFLVTVCPHEAQNYEVGGEEWVDAVPMPPAVAAMVGRFVAEHHVDEPFVKRKRTPHGAPGIRGRGHG